MFYITTAIAYPNGQPHIGHAYEAIATDAIARFQRLDGKDVFFLTGTDEHGLKMIQTAEAEGLTPAELAARNALRFKQMDEVLNVSFDRFIRTTEPAHHRSVQEVWKRMQASGDIYVDTYAGWYSVRDEAYYDEGETVLGEDGVRRGPQGTPVEWVEEKSYFFRLSAYQDRLLDLYESQPDFIGPDSRRNEVMSFVKGGLKDDTPEPIVQGTFLNRMDYRVSLFDWNGVGPFELTTNGTAMSSATGSGNSAHVGNLQGSVIFQVNNSAPLAAGDYSDILRISLSPL